MIKKEVMFDKTFAYISHHNVKNAQLQIFDN